MSIRKAILADSEAIEDLLDQLDYPDTGGFLKQKMEMIFQNPLVILLVYEQEGRVVAFMVLEFLVQLGLKGDIARIGYFSVDHNYRGKGVGQAMEQYAEEQARERNCDRMEVHCHERRKDAHRFYYRQGYTESPKYLIKSLESR